MKTPDKTTALAGVGATAACAACCAGPILAALSAVGLGTVLGVAVFGVAGLAVAVLGVVLVLRSRRSATSCATVAEPVAVALSPRRAPAEPSTPAGP